MGQLEMSVITAVTLVIYGLVMRHERMKRIPTKRKKERTQLSARRSRPRVDAPRTDNLLRVALAPLLLGRRKFH